MLRANAAMLDAMGWSWRQIMSAPWSFGISWRPTARVAPLTVAWDEASWIGALTEGPGMKVTLPTKVSPRDPFQASVNLGGLRLMSPLIGSSDPGRWTALDRRILMPGSRIAPEARLSKVIVAPGTIIPHGMEIGGDRGKGRRCFRLTGDMTLVASGMLERRGVLRTLVSSVFSSPPDLPTKAQWAT